MAELKDSIVNGNLRVTGTVNLSNPLPTASGGTGYSGSNSASVLTYLINSLEVGTSDAQLDDYYVCQYAGGGTSNTTYYRRKVNALFNCFKSALGIGNSSGLNKYFVDLDVSRGSSGESTYKLANDSTDNMTAASAQSYFGSMPTYSMRAIYKQNGDEASVLMGKGSDGQWGNILQWGCTDNYLRMLRKKGGTWQNSGNWEKISAGFADAASRVSASTSSGAEYKLIGVQATTSGSYTTYFNSKIRACQDSSNGALLLLGSESGTGGTADKGVIRFADGNGHYAHLSCDGNIGTNRAFYLPKASGPLAAKGQLGYQLDQLGGSGAYCQIAKLLANPGNGQAMCDVYISNIGDFGGNFNGSYVVHMSTRGSNTLAQVKTVFRCSDETDFKIYTFTENGYTYLVLYRGPYSPHTTITFLNVSGNAEVNIADNLSTSGRTLTEGVYDQEELRVDTGSGQGKKRFVASAAGAYVYDNNGNITTPVTSVTQSGFYAYRGGVDVSENINTASSVNASVAVNTPSVYASSSLNATGTSTNYTTITKDQIHSQTSSKYVTINPGAANSIATNGNIVTFAGIVQGHLRPGIIIYATGDYTFWDGDYFNPTFIDQTLILVVNGNASSRITITSGCHRKNASSTTSFTKQIAVRGCGLFFAIKNNDGSSTGGYDNAILPIAFL